MKKLLFIPLLLLIIITNTSCDKENRSVSTLIINKWTLESYTVGGIDLTLTLAGLQWDIQQSGLLVATSLIDSTFEEQSTWTLTNDEGTFTVAMDTVITAYEIDKFGATQLRLARLVADSDTTFVEEVLQFRD